MKKWHSEIVAALEKAGRPMRTGEVTDAVLGSPTHEYWPSVANMVSDAYRAGLVGRRRGPAGFNLYFSLRRQ